MNRWFVFLEYVLGKVISFCPTGGAERLELGRGDLSPLSSPASLFPDLP